MKKSFIVFGLLTAAIISVNSVIAESTIYTDGLGRMHFLGKDPASNAAKGANYANPEQQDLTRRLYENSTGELNYVDRPLKDYENTFSDSRYSNWKKKFQSNVDEARVDVNSKTKATFSAEKGANDVPNAYGFTNTNIDQSISEKNVIENKSKSSKWFKKKSK